MVTDTVASVFCALFHTAAERWENKPDNTAVPQNRISEMAASITNL